MTCISVRAKKDIGHQCTAKALPGSEWCGKHKSSQQRFVQVTIEKIEHIPRSPPRSPPSRSDLITSVLAIQRSWRSWLSRRCGPLLRFKAEANNPFDFFSSDPIEEIKIAEFISFVDSGKGYIMDIKSVSSLLEHAQKTDETPANPFNRNKLPDLFLRRYKRHVGKKGPVLWSGLQAVTETQKYELAATDIFRSLEDLGNYTNPEWFLGLSHIGLQRLYIELADIWYHRASLAHTDRLRIVPPPHKAFKIPVTTVLIMRPKALKPLLVETCQLLVTAAASKGDRQLGGMYILGALTLVSEGAASAFPWLLEMFSPGVSRVINGELMLAHQSVLAY
jgi:hypothetical protein